MEHLEAESGFIFPELEGRNISEFYDIREIVGVPGNKGKGNGRFGVVRKALKKDETKELYAVKIINKKLKRNKVNEEGLKREVEILRKVTHTSIVKFEDVFEDDDYVYIVMEYCGGGELFFRIAGKKTFSEKQARDCLLPIFKGVKYLHDNHIIHCDLKPENFVFKNNFDWEDEKCYENNELKIVDFGQSKIWIPSDDVNKRYFRDNCGTVGYCAPETIQKNPGYKEPADLWSLGVVMFILLYGYYPFFYQDDMKLSPNEAQILVEKRILEGFKPIEINGVGPHFPIGGKYDEHKEKISEEAKQLIGKLLNPSPLDRITIEQVLSDPWVTKERIDSPFSPFVLNGFKTFAVSKLKHAIIERFNLFLNQSESETVRNIFKNCDKNEDGKISREEFHKFWENLGMSKKESDALHSKADVNKDGFLSLEELRNVFCNKYFSENEELLFYIYSIIDRNNDGYITKDELKFVLGKYKYDVKELETMIDEHDRNGDGKIDYFEYLLMFNKLTEEEKERLEQNGKEYKSKKRHHKDISDNNINSNDIPKTVRFKKQGI